MSIHTLGEKIKALAGERRQTLVFIGILLCTAVVSFYLGYVARIETRTSAATASRSIQNGPLSDAGGNTTNDVPSLKTAPKTSSQATTGNFVASKNGTKYYPTSCSGAKRIKDANKVFYQTAAEAQADGYSLASGC